MIGHNTADGKELQSFINRIESLEQQKSEIANDFKEVFAEAKGRGFDVKTLKAIIKLRKEDADKRAEREALLETYMAALGMLATTPLGEAALRRA